MRPLFRVSSVLLLPLIMSGCVAASETFEPDLGFGAVSADAGRRLGKQTVWVQDQAQAAAAN
ncbi:MAG: TolC family protein, partial [Aurantimonas coralicida]|nr:TolC family protein [Aurantimonas coralicida]